MEKTLQRLSEIKNSFDRKKDSLTRFGVLTHWGLIKDDLPGDIEIPSPSDAEETALLRYTWASGQNAVWFTTDMTLPTELEKISLVGSKAELLLWFTIGAKIYINGELKAKEPFWATSLHLPITVTDEIKDEQRYEFAIHVPRGDGFGVFLRAEVRTDAINDVVIELEKSYYEFDFIYNLIQEGRLGSDALDVLNKALDEVDLKRFEKNEWKTFWESLRNAREVLLPYQQECKKFTSYLIGHAHIDMNWLWTWEDTIETCRRDFSTIDALMDEYPAFRFSQSQASTYWAMKDHHPDLYNRIKERFKEEKWEITASTWVEGDVNMVSGESLVRQILYTGFYFAKEFGYQPVVCWEPDTFGHSSMMPQVLAKSGVKYYYCTRAGKDLPLFWWESPDGSRVLAFWDPYFYNGEINSEEIVGGNVELYKKNKITKNMFVYGVGDHGGGPTRNDLYTLEKLNSNSLLPTMQCSKAEDFFKAVENEKLPVIKDELNPYWTACLTTHADVKRIHRLTENNLHDTEVACSFAALLGKEYPVVELQKAWREFVFNQFHDIICGCAIHTTYEQSNREVKAVLDVSNKLKHEAIDYIMDSIVIEDSTIVVFNSLSWEHAGVVEFDASELRLSTDGSYIAEDAEGGVVPIQIYGNNALFEANVPAWGYKAYKIKSADRLPKSPLHVDPGNLVLENDSLYIQIHPKSGVIARLYDKEADRELAPVIEDWKSHREFKDTLGDLNVLQVSIEQPHSMAAWNIGSILRVENLVAECNIEVLEQGPVRGCIKVVHTYKQSPITQYISLAAGSRRIDFKTHIDWKEEGNAVNGIPLLQASFLPNLGKTEANFEVPFGRIMRNADGTEVPALRWSDISEDDYGVSLLNDCKYGHSIEGNRLKLTLLRCSYEPDLTSDIGEHDFTYSLYPHLGNYKEAQTFRRARELNHSLYTKISANLQQGALPPAFSLFSLEPAHLNLSTVKASETEWERLGSRNDTKHMEITLRIYNTEGMETEARLQSAAGIKAAWELDLRETEEKELRLTNEEEIVFTVSPYEIKTIKLLLARELP